MNFFKKYIALPERFGYFPYVWLLFLFFPISYAYPYRTLKQQMMMLIILIFVVAYRNSYASTKWRFGWIWVQIITSMILAMMIQALYLNIYVAWVFGSIPMHRRQFRWFYGAYMGSILIPTIYFYFYYGQQMGGFEWVGIIVYGLFCALSPFAAHSIQDFNRKNRQLMQTNERLTTMIKQNERQRIARDLHDNLGQSFSMITLKAEYARRLLTKAPEKVPEQLLEIEQASRHNLQMVRDIVTDLRQVTIAEELIQQEQNLRVASMLLFTKNEALSEQLPQASQQVLAQCIHEAVTNMIRYSRATECDIQFEQLATLFQMKISDNGRGLRDSDQVKSNGIPGMRERLATLNGELMITSNRSGTCLTIEIPAEGVQA